LGSVPVRSHWKAIARTQKCQFWVHGARDGEVFPLARPVPSAEASALCWHPRCLLHESVIVAAIRIVARWHAPTGVNYPALVAVSFTAIPAIYELAVRRYRITPVPVRHENRQLSVGQRSIPARAAES
jgi:hypothetical protein